MPVPKPRIVSLIASATEIACELGFRDALVGRSHECDFPPGIETLPCCTRPRFDCSGSSREIDSLVKHSLQNALSIYEIFDDVFEQLQPTHILTQTQCEVCAVSLQDVERSVASRLASKPRIVSLQPNSLEDIWEDMRRVAESLDADAEPAIGSLQTRIRSIRDLAHAQRARPRVACLEWLEPLMAAGNWTPQLVELANGLNLFGAPGKHSPWMKWEEVREADPDVVIAMPCGFSIERTLGEMHWITSRPGYRDLRAVREDRVFVADGNQYFNRPGPRVVECVQILAEILHPAMTRGQLAGAAYRRFRSAGN